MPPIPQESWLNLFSAGENHSPGVSLNMRVLRKRGQPFLLLPANPSLAVKSLGLYSAQNFRARFAKRVLTWLLRLQISWSHEKASLTVSPNDSFIGFLSKLVGGPPALCPAFAILAGNPAVEGRRFVILVFNADKKPVAVVKAGLGVAARQLIEKERAFLASVPRETIGAPKLRDTFHSPNISALAMDYFVGDSPRASDQHNIATLLSSWLDKQRTIPWVEVPVWHRLNDACGSNPLFLNLTERLKRGTVHPTIFHGDFAPWNIKVSTGDNRWAVLDWERGELAGIPGWDWFHYVIQTGILVERLPTQALVQKIKALLASPDFQRYAEQAGFIGREIELVLAYLLHHIGVIKPTEGLSAARELLSALSTPRTKH